jgi:hypothetical protein
VREDALVERALRKALAVLDRKGTREVARCALEGLNLVAGAPVRFAAALAVVDEAGAHGRFAAADALVERLVTSPDVSPDAVWLAHAIPQVLGDKAPQVLDLVRARSDMLCLQLDRTWPGTVAALPSLLTSHLPGILGLAALRASADPSWSLDRIATACALVKAWHVVAPSDLEAHRRHMETAWALAVADLDRWPTREVDGRDFSPWDWGVLMTSAWVVHSDAVLRLSDPDLVYVAIERLGYFFAKIRPLPNHRWILGQYNAMSEPMQKAIPHLHALVAEAGRGEGTTKERRSR